MFGSNIVWIFYFVDVTQLNDYKYIRDKTQFLIAIKDQNSFWFTILFFLFYYHLDSFVRVRNTNFINFAGFLFGKFYGTLISVLGFTFGCTLLYILANQYFKDIILEKLSNKISKFKDMFNRNEFLYFMIFRFAGGGGTPFAIQNLLPVIFNMKIKNYFFSTLLVFSLWCLSCVQLVKE